MKSVVLLPAAAKALRKHRAEAERILAKIEAYAADPASQANNVKILAGMTARRLCRRLSRRLRRDRNRDRRHQNRPARLGL
jgi:hypothetical protein